MEDPYRFLAVQGTLDMIESAPDKVLPVIPQVHTPITKSVINLLANPIIQGGPFWEGVLIFAMA